MVVLPNQSQLVKVKQIKYPNFNLLFKRKSDLDQSGNSEGVVQSITMPVDVYEDISQRYCLHVL